VPAEDPDEAPAQRQNVAVVVFVRRRADVAVPGHGTRIPAGGPAPETYQHPRGRPRDRPQYQLLLAQVEDERQEPIRVRDERGCQRLRVRHHAG